MYTFAAVVVLASILCFFSQEFVRTFKKVLAIKGASLLLPLLLGSVLVFNFQEWAAVMVYYYHDIVQGLVRFMTHVIPFKTAAIPIAQVFWLTVLTVGPVYWLDWYLERKTFYGYKYIFGTCAIIWVVTVVAIVVLPPVI